MNRRREVGKPLVLLRTPTAATPGPQREWNVRGGTKVAAMTDRKRLDPGAETFLLGSQQPAASKAGGGGNPEEALLAASLLR
jgi:hypothetical protein